MGNVRQWSEFQRGLGKLKKTYGFNVFHGKDFKARRGEFTGWPPTKCLSLSYELTSLASNGVMQASVISLDNAEFKTQYRGGETPKKLRLDSAYGLCFRICLIHQISEIFRRLSAHKKFDQTRLNIVMERGHKNAPDAARIYDEEATNLQKYDCNLLSGLTFASKDCEPLMLADFLADTTGLRDDKGIISVPNQAFAGIREKAALTHLSFEPGDLSKTKEALIEALNARCASAASLRQRRGGEDV